VNVDISEFAENDNIYYVVLAMVLAPIYGDAPQDHKKIGKFVSNERQCWLYVGVSREPVRRRWLFHPAGSRRIHAWFGGPDINDEKAGSDDRGMRAPSTISKSVERIERAMAAPPARDSGPIAGAHSGDDLHRKY